MRQQNDPETEPQVVYSPRKRLRANGYTPANQEVESFLRHQGYSEDDARKIVCTTTQHRHVQPAAPSKTQATSSGRFVDHVRSAGASHASPQDLDLAQELAEALSSQDTHAAPSQQTDLLSQFSAELVAELCSTADQIDERVSSQLASQPIRMDERQLSCNGNKAVPPPPCAQTSLVMPSHATLPGMARPPEQGMPLNQPGFGGVPRFGFVQSSQPNRPWSQQQVPVHASFPRPVVAQSPHQNKQLCQTGGYGGVSNSWSSQPQVQVTGPKSNNYRYPVQNAVNGVFSSGSVSTFPTSQGSMSSGMRQQQPAPTPVRSASATRSQPTLQSMPAAIIARPQFVTTTMPMRPAPTSERFIDDVDDDALLAKICEVEHKLSQEREERLSQAVAETVPAII